MVHLQCTNGFWTLTQNNPASHRRGWSRWSQPDQILGDTPYVVSGSHQQRPEGQENCFGIFLRRVFAFSDRELPQETAVIVMNQLLRFVHY